MPYKFNPFSGIFDLVNTAQDLSDYLTIYVQGSAPSSPVEGKTMWMDTTLHELKYWYNSTWQVLHTFTVATYILLLEDSLTDGIELESGSDRLALQ